MNTHAAKTPSSGGYSVANDVSATQTSAAALPDNRPAAVAQRKLQQAADSRPQAQQAGLLQRMVDASAPQQPMQLKAADAGVVQMNRPKGNKKSQAKAAAGGIKGKKKHHVRPEYAQQNQRQMAHIQNGVSRKDAKRMAKGTY